MSLLEAILQKKQRLRSSETLVTLPSGQIYRETLLDGITTVSLVQNVSSPGYVVDTKPDFSVSHILTHLCMGSQDVVQDQALLLQHKITHVLSIGVPAVGLVAEFETLFIEALDLPETDLIPVLEKSIAFIDHARDVQGRVFVHCNAGVSRSASVIIGYLIKEGMSFIHAYQYLKERRKVVNPNEGFISQLKKYEATLKKQNPI
ncbi:dual specificity protein phosphatase 19-like [Anabrus simplex]|uniref:dual specificity protein phosphatase 19-like n=1 Tax=Anabrus simplex TaxID=316456 RepID=UPI0035A2E26B